MKTVISHIESSGGNHVMKVKTPQLGGLIEEEEGRLTIRFYKHGITVAVADKYLETVHSSKDISYDEFVKWMLSKGEHPPLGA